MEPKRNVSSRRGNLWRIYSGQRSVPGTQDTGQHNYLILVDRRGEVRREIHGVAADGFTKGRLGVQEYIAQRDESGRYNIFYHFDIGSEDRSKWVPVLPMKGLTAQ